MRVEADVLRFVTNVMFDGDGDEQGEREAGDDGVMHWHGLQERAKESGGELAEKAGWEC